MSRTLGALCGALAMLVLFGASAMSANTKQMGPPVLTPFEFSCTNGKIVKGQMSACLQLNQQSSLMYHIAKNGGMTMEISIRLPKKVAVLYKKVRVNPPDLILDFKPTYAEQNPKLVTDKNGVTRLVWRMSHLEQAGYPILRLKLADKLARLKLCISAKGTPINITGAPVQWSHPACFVRTSL